MKRFCTLAVHVIAILLLVGHASAQKPEDPGPYKAGYRTITFANKYAGSTSIPCLVAYPAKTAGKNTAIDLSGAPYPVIVFGHGMNTLGQSHQNLAVHYASWGFLFVAPDTFQYGPQSSQSLDMQALTRIIRDEHGRSGSFLHGGVDVKHFGIGGWSMGGGASGNVLGSSADVQVGLLLAPWDGIGKKPPYVDSSESMKTARAPFHILAGLGDYSTPPSTQAIKFYQKGSGVRGYRGMLTLWKGCDHGSPVGKWKGTPTPDQIEAWRLCRRQQTAFMLAHLKGRHDMLDVLVGTATHNEPKFDKVDYVVVDPDLYLTGTPKVGGKLDYHVMAWANTTAFTYVSPASANYPLPGLGTLGLHPGLMVGLSSLPTSTEQVLHASFPIPNASALAGLRIWIQALAVDASNTYRLTPTRDFRIAAGP